MTPLERAALEHATAWVRYVRTPQARADLEASRRLRAAADAKTGHTPACTLTRCSPDCQKRVCTR